MHVNLASNSGCQIFSYVFEIIAYGDQHEFERNQ
jgi:hypothetical protein